MNNNSLSQSPSSDSIDSFDDLPQSNHLTQPSTYNQLEEMMFKDDMLNNQHSNAGNMSSSWSFPHIDQTHYGFGLQDQTPAPHMSRSLSFQPTQMVHSPYGFGLQAPTQAPPMSRPLSSQMFPTSTQYYGLGSDIGVGQINSIYTDNKGKPYKSETRINMKNQHNKTKSHYNHHGLVEGYPYIPHPLKSRNPVSPEETMIKRQIKLAINNIITCDKNKSWVNQSKGDYIKTCGYTAPGIAALLLFFSEHNISSQDELQTKLDELGITFPTFIDIINEVIGNLLDIIKGFCPITTVYKGVQ